jgi:hypothetical protein
MRNQAGKAGRGEAERTANFQKKNMTVPQREMFKGVGGVREKSDAALSSSVKKRAAI